MAAALVEDVPQLKVTAALKAAVANAIQISVRHVVPALSPRTNAHVSPPPVTELTVDLVDGKEIEAIRSSFGPEVVSVPVVSVRPEDVMLATIATSKATGIMSPLWLL
jgi:hypothetical protein